MTALSSCWPGFLTHDISTPAMMPLSPLTSEDRQPDMTPPANSERCKTPRFPGELLSHGGWLAYRFPLS